MDADPRGNSRFHRSRAAQSAALAAELMADFEAVYGYPAGKNVVDTANASPEAGAALRDAGVPGDLCTFYEAVAEISLPDLGNGLFVHSAESVLDGLAGVQPTALTGAFRGRIVVFGSDGGGTLFAERVPEGTILALRSGTLVGDTFEVDEEDVDELATDLPGFLDWFRDVLAGSVP